MIKRQKLFLLPNSTPHTPLSRKIKWVLVNKIIEALVNKIIEVEENGITSLWYV
jgi:hypothetical protein